jgi:hypothetical protein
LSRWATGSFPRRVHLNGIREMQLPALVDKHEEFSFLVYTVTSCSLMKVNRRFQGTYRLRLQGCGVSQARNQHEAVRNQSFLASYWFLGRPALPSWRWGWYVPPKRRLTFTRLYGVISQKVRTQVRSCGICGGRNGIGAGFLRVFRFPLEILIPQTAPHSSSIIRGWYNRPITGRGTKWTQRYPPQETKKKLYPTIQNCS